MICPFCESSDIRRSATVGWERVPRLLFAVKHFRCRDCNARWAASQFDLEEDKKTILFWAVAMTVACLGLMGLL